MLLYCVNVNNGDYDIIDIQYHTINIENGVIEEYEEKVILTSP